MPVNFFKVQSLFLIILGKYLHPLHVNFIKTIVGVGPSRARSGVLLAKTHLKGQTLIALMSIYIQNHKSVLLKSVIGLAAYAYGVQAKVFKLFNMFGITCGMDIIRRLANHWFWSRKVTLRKLIRSHSKELILQLEF